MAKPIIISQEEARKITLYSQGLLSPFDSSLAVIKQLGYVQIDTISVTERAHNHVFFTRNPIFYKEEIGQLMDDKSIFEYWSHAAAYLPMKDFRYSLFRKEEYKDGDKHWFPRDKKVDRYVIDKIKTEGPLQSKDFDTPKKTNGWYEWKPAKIALTNLFMDGSLMISKRKGFHKVFDLTERVIPPTTNTIIPSAEDYTRHLIVSTIKAHGLLTLNEICYLRKGIKLFVKETLQQLLEARKIIAIYIEDDNTVYYSSTNNEIPTIKKQLHILSPFDNLVIQRKRLKKLFNFNYQIECYVPEKKRVFGYYTLPIIYGDEFVARFDAKADRKTRLFTIKGFWFEDAFKPTDAFYKTFFKQLKFFVKFCGCEEIKVQKVSPNKYKQELNSFI